MTVLIDVPMSNNHSIELTVNGRKFNDEYYIQPLGSMIGKDMIQTKNIMFESDDAGIMALLWQGVKRIRVDKPKKQWHYCKCGMVIKHTKRNTATHGTAYTANRYILGAIPYPTQHPKNSVIAQTTAIRGGKYNPSSTATTDQEVKE